MTIAEFTNECPRVKNIVENSLPSNFTRLTSIIDGNYMIQALLTFTKLGGRCDEVSLSGLLNYYSIKYAIDRANNNTNLTPRVTIGMRLDDNCDKLPVTMARGVEVITLVKNAPVCHFEFMQCNANSLDSPNIKIPTAMVGTEMSSTTIPLATLMSLYQIPLISHSASSRLLSSSEMYRSFVRTIPSDSLQVQAMLRVIENFNWNYIFAIGSNDDYGKLAIAELKSEAKKKKICILNTFYITYRGKNMLAEITSALGTIKNESKATVVVLFCYFSGLGDAILIEAQKANISRMWLTSDAWNPEALNKSFKNNAPVNQMHGLLSISMKLYPRPELYNYIKNEIITDFKCNMWLQNYFKNNFNCEPTSISSDNMTLLGPNNCNITVSYVTQQLYDEGQNFSSLVEAVTVLTSGIQKYVKTYCKTEDCSITTINHATLTGIIKNISIQNDVNDTISFNNSNDPVYASYTVDNLQYVDGDWKYVTVGSWSNEKRNISFFINENNIKWPNWVNNGSLPISRCSPDCVKGQFIQVLPNECCWQCGDCKGFYNFTNTSNAENCMVCDKGYHTVDHIKCNKTEVTWLSYRNTSGIAILIVASIGLVFNILASSLLFKFRRFLEEDGSFSRTLLLSCVLPFVSFSFGFLNVFEPTDWLCGLRYVVFFLILMSFSAGLLIKTKIVGEYVENKAGTFKCNLLTAQIVIFTLLLLVEMIPVIILILTFKPSKSVDNGSSIQKSCSLGFTAPSLVSNFLPLILLIVATCCAFRERNMEHIFYEPKFFSFTCIALCVGTAAYLLTFNFVKDELKSIVMTFTLSIFALIYMACLILPKIYVGQGRHRHGNSFIQKRPTNAFRDRKNTTSNKRDSNANNNNTENISEIRTESL